MNKMTAFVLLFVFAILFLLSYMPDVLNKSIGKVMGIAGQVGMAVSMILFFIVRGRENKQ